MRALLVCLLTFLPAGADDGFTIGGSVVDHTTQRPLNKIMVTLIARNGKSVAAITGPDGQFHFLHVPKGKYTLEANTRSGRSQQYRQHEQYSTGIVAGPGQDSQNIVFALNGTASIGGTVLDERNEPIGQAQIFMFRKGVAEGKFSMMQWGSSQSGTDGKFVASDLPPGTYFAAVQARPWFAQNGSHSELDVVYPLTYYGGSSDPNSATAITLHEGDATDIQFILRTVPALHLKMPPAENGVAPNIQMFAIGPGGISLPAGFGVATMPDPGGLQHMELIGLAPGEYRLQVMRSESAPAEANVSLHSGTDLSAIDTKPSATLEGQVNFQGGKALPNGIILRFSCGNFVQITQDGKFTSKNQLLKPGRCAVEILNVPNAVIDSLTVNGRAGSDDTFEVPAAGHLQLVIGVSQSEGSTSFSGVVVQDGKTLAGAMVLLVPDDLTRTTRLRRDQSDSDGSFELRDVHAGKYTLVAIDDGSELAYLEPGELKPYLTKGVALEFPLKDGKPLQVEAQKRRHS